MQYTLKRVIDTHPEWIERLKKKCYAVNGCCMTIHKDLGPFLNEYMYQDGLKILFNEQQIPYQKEYCFSINYHGQRIEHKHYVDFLIQNEIILECKAVENLAAEHRQQLWNYMRLTGKPIGILYNFGPINAQSEHYYLDKEGTMYMF
jgi:GxxExxY protein